MNVNKPVYGWQVPGSSPSPLNSFPDGGARFGAHASAASGKGQPRFGAHTAAAAASGDDPRPASPTAGKNRKPLWSDLRIAFQKAKEQIKNEDTKIVKAAKKKYGPDLFMAVCTVIPFGWPLAILGYIPSMIISGRGDKDVENLKKEGRLAGDGVLKRILAIHHIWDEVPGDASEIVKDGKKPKPPAATRIMNEINRLLEELFPHTDKDSKMQAVKNRLKMTETSKAFLKLSHALDARRRYYGTMMGKVHKGVGRFLKGPAKPLKLPFVLAGFSRQLFYYLRRA